MATKKAKRPSFTSPKGVFRYPAITKPDFGNEQFPKPHGEYKVQLVLSREDAQPLLDKLEPLFQEAIAEGEDKFSKLKIEQRKKLKELKVNELFAEEYDKETEEPTGNIIFKFATTASGVNEKKEKWERKIAVFDAKGKPLPKPPAIYGGTVGKISFEVGSYFIPGTGSAGLKLYLSAVQIIDLVSGGQRSASGYGFGAEDGYEGSDETTSSDAPFDADETSSGTGDENEDF